MISDNLIAIFSNPENVFEYTKVQISSLKMLPRLKDNQEKEGFHFIGVFLEVEGFMYRVDVSKPIRVEADEDE